MRFFAHLKFGMKRANVTHSKPRNYAAEVPEIHGKAKHGNAQANPTIAGTHAPGLKVYHTKSFPDAYSEFDSDLARDNLENDLTSADLQDS